MSFTKEEIERSYAHGDIALGHVKTRRFHAMPRNYEIWYSYVSGIYNALSNSINDILSKKGVINQDDLDDIYEQYLSPTRISGEVDKVGAQVVGEIDQMMSLIEVALSHNGEYRENLSTATEELKTTHSAEKLRAVVRNLLMKTQENEENSRLLESHLRQTRDQVSQLQQHLEVVRNESYTDPLTSLYNRKYFDQALLRTIEDTVASGKPLSILMADIDHFKAFNDNYGHLTGDQVLRLVANAIKSNVKGQDLACRFGGEEFVVILPDTSMRAAVAAAENIRRAVMTKELVRRSTSETLGRITLSLGVATWNGNDTAHSVIERADTCLYAAKNAGRNRVLCETDPEVELRRSPASIVA